MKKSIFVVAFLFTATWQLLAASVYYIDGTYGNDSNTGLSASSPWRTIGKANSTLRPGDKVYIRTGSYAETIAPANSGINGNPITYQRYGSDQVTITNVSNGILLSNRRYVIIDGLQIMNVGRFVVISNASQHNTIMNCRMEGASEWGGVRIENSSHNSILNNYIYNGRGDLVELYPNADYNLIKGNEINGGPLNTHSCLLIRSTETEDYCSYNVIKDNYIHGGFDDNVNVLQRVEHNLFEGNILEGVSGGAGLKFCGGQNNIFRKNMAVNCKSIGFGIYTSLYGSYQAYGEDNVFYQNVAYRSDRGSDMDSGFRLVVFQDGGEIKNNVIKNNIFMNNAPQQIYVCAVVGLDNKLKNNQFSANAIYSPTTNYNIVRYLGVRYSLPDIESLTGSGFTGNKTFDPLFVDPGNKDFHLRSNSPAINKGAFLTRTSSSGSGTIIKVDDARYFSDGFGVIEGDIIQLQGQTETARILIVDYNNNLITLDRILNWTSGLGISLPYAGSAPDLGAYEYGLNQDSTLAASVAASPSSGQAPLPVVFSASATGGAPPYEFLWDFGDGQTSTSQNPSHTYASVGTYVANLTVSDSLNATVMKSVTINVSATAGRLVASLLATPVSGDVPLVVSFSGSATGGTLPYSFSWDFGDGQASTSQNPSWTYANAGIYMVNLTVTDSSGATAGAGVTITAVAPGTHGYGLSISSATGAPAPGQGGTTEPPPGTHNFSAGSYVELRSIPNDKYRFSKWTGDVGAAGEYQPSIHLLIDGVKTAVANFCTNCADVNGDLILSPADAQMAFDIYLGKINNPTWCELENADVNASGSAAEPKITPADAQTIFNKYLKKGILPADCSGIARLTAATELSFRNPGQTKATVSLGSSARSFDGDLFVPVVIDSALTIGAFGFDLLFPSEDLVFIRAERSDLTAGFLQMEANVTAPGLLRVGGYASQPASQEGSAVLVTLVFRIVGPNQSPAFSIADTCDDIDHIQVTNTFVDHRQLRKERDGQTSRRDRRLSIKSRPF